MNDDEQTPEILASSIKSVADAAKKLLSGPLTRRAVFLLIRDKSGVGIREVEAVLDAASRLDSFLVKPKVATK